MKRNPTLIDIVVSCALGFAMILVGCLIAYNIIVYGLKFVSPGVVLAVEECPGEFFVNPKTEFPVEKAREMITIAEGTLDNCDSVLADCPFKAQRVFSKVCLVLRDDLGKCRRGIEMYERGEVKDWKALHAMIANGFVEACFLEYLIYRFKEEET